MVMIDPPSGFRQIQDSINRRMSRLHAVTMAELMVRLKAVPVDEAHESVAGPVDEISLGGEPDKWDRDHFEGNPSDNGPTE